MPHAVLLYPFWGLPDEPPSDPTRGRYDRYVASGSQIFELSGWEDADAIVLPAHWEHVERDPAAVRRAQELSELARRAGKPLLVFYVSDSTAPVPLEGATVMRTSLYRSRRRPGEAAVVAFSQDIGALRPDAATPARPAGARPVVGFCGLARGRRRPARLLTRARASLTGAGTRTVDGSIRGEACDLLAKDSRFETRFVFRERFWAGVVADDGSVDYEAMRAARAEYVENLVQSDYVVCARGGGNFSYRLYEALSVGRIPIFIDTDCVLPFESQIDWRSLCVWVDETELTTIGDRLAEFHATLAQEGLAEHQRQCRRVFADYLSVEGFFRQLARRGSA
jgi:hypothetical protein